MNDDWAPIEKLLAERRNIKDEQRRAKNLSPRQDPRAADLHTVQTSRAHQQAKDKDAVGDFYR